MDQKGIVWAVLAVLLGALFWVWILMPHAAQPADVVSTKPATLPAAAQLQQQHPDWPMYYCQRIVNGTVSTGMTREMVLLAWGTPDRQLTGPKMEILPYCYISYAFPDIPASCSGVRNLVEIENNVVTQVVRMNIYEDDLSKCVGWSKDTVLLCFGEAHDIVESSGSNAWTYELHPFCKIDRNLEKNKADSVTLYFTPSGTVRSWMRY